MRLGIDAKRLRRDKTVMADESAASARVMDVARAGGAISVSSAKLTPGPAGLPVASQNSTRWGRIG
jgi:hypothetical protein